LLLDDLLASGRGQPLYTLWAGALGTYPDITLLRGDASCDGEVDAIDALRLIQTTAGINNPGICAFRAGNVDCDGDSDAIDALMVLRWIAGLPTNAPDGCPAIGTG
jgi:hypothetical protein